MMYNTLQFDQGFFYATFLFQNINVGQMKSILYICWDPKGYTYTCAYLQGGTPN